MTIGVIVVPVEGEPEVRAIPPTLEAMQALVGGYIEPVRLTGGVHLYVNEEGILRNLPVNPTLTAVFGFWLQQEMQGPGFLSADEDGEPRSLTDREIAEWLPGLIERRAWGR